MIQIPDPCHEDWSKMKIVRKGRHCLSCTKNVIDFTKMERYEIIEYLLLNKDKSVCGHINKSMLDFDVEELYLTVQRAETIKRSSNLAFSILSMGALFLASCSNETPKDNSGQTYKGEVAKIEVQSSSGKKEDDIKPSNKTLSSKDEPEVVVGGCEIQEIDGEISLEIPNKEEKKTIEGELIFDDLAFEPQADFPGGIVALRKYLTENLKIPESVSESGKVYVKFVVKNDGSIGNVQFLRNYSNDENLKKEITRVLQSMPNWNPGKVDGKNVNSYMTLPISINLGEKQ